MNTPGNTHDDSAYTAALSVKEFCRAYSISRALFYVLLRKGQGPRVMRVGSRVLVSVDAARSWQRQYEGA